MLPDRDENGQLPKWAWPGGYPLYYASKDGLDICSDCANREVDPSQEPISAYVNYEDHNLYCEDCGRRIEAAYDDPDE